MNWVLIAIIVVGSTATLSITKGLSKSQCKVIQDQVQASQDILQHEAQLRVHSWCIKASSSTETSESSK